MNATQPYVLDGTSMSSDCDYVVKLRKRSWVNLLRRVAHDGWKMITESGVYVWETDEKYKQQIKASNFSDLDVEMLSKNAGRNYGRKISAREFVIKKDGRRLFSFGYVWMGGGVSLEIDYSVSMSVTGQNIRPVRIKESQLYEKMSVPFSCMSEMFAELGEDPKFEEFRVNSLQLAVYSSPFESEQERNTVLWDLYSRCCVGNGRRGSVSAGEIAGFKVIESKSELVEVDTLVHKGATIPTGFALDMKNYNAEKDNYEPFLMVGFYAKDLKEKLKLKKYLDYKIKEQSFKKPNSEVFNSKFDVVTEEAYDHLRINARDLTNAVNMLLRIDITMHQSFLIEVGAGKTLEEICVWLNKLNIESTEALVKRVLFEEIKIHQFLGARMNKKGKLKEAPHDEILENIEEKYPNTFYVLKNVGLKPKSETSLAKICDAIRTDDRKYVQISKNTYLWEKFNAAIKEEFGVDLIEFPVSVFEIANQSAKQSHTDTFEVFRKELGVRNPKNGANKVRSLRADLEKLADEAVEMSRDCAIKLLKNFEIVNIPFYSRKAQNNRS